MPTDLTQEGTSNSWAPGGHPPVAIDLSDNIHLLGGNNESICYWFQGGGGGGWTARDVLYQGQEGQASPNQGLVWAGPGRTRLVLVESYAGHSFEFVNGAWSPLPALTIGRDLVGYFTLGNDPQLWALAADSSTFAAYVYPWSGSEWGTPMAVADMLPDFTINWLDRQACCPVIYHGNGGVLLFTNVAFQDRNYAVLFDGVNFSPELQLDEIFGGTYDGGPTFNNPLVWIGKPGSGQSEYLADGSIVLGRTTTNT
jgi:hypothetical protein